MDNNDIVEILKNIRDELYSIKLVLRKERDYYDGVKVINEEVISDERTVGSEEAVLQVVRCFSNILETDNIFYSVVICFRNSFESSRSNQYVTLQNFLKLDKALSYFNRYLDKKGSLTIYENKNQKD